MKLELERKKNIYFIQAIFSYIYSGKFSIDYIKEDSYGVFDIPDTNYSMVIHKNGKIKIQNIDDKEWEYFVYLVDIAKRTKYR